MNKSLSNYDHDAYAKAISYISRFSRLYSTSDQAYIVYRFAEKLFCATTGADDLASKDISFDARMGTRGVGIKTFIALNSQTVKREKIAEFTRDASVGEFAGLPHAELARRVSELRNARVSSDAAEIGVGLMTSLYHCLIRFPGYARVHEEPYDLIDIPNIAPLTVGGAPRDSFENKDTGTVYFTDGRHNYQFGKAKNTLLKSFDLETSFLSGEIRTPISESIWDEVLGARIEVPSVESRLVVDDDDFETEPTKDFVVLPLYSTQNKVLREVPLKSGINQWNAGGRARSFGEAYIPVPAAIHKLRPGFFPPRDTKFELRLPNGEVVLAKICQDGSKALMSDPNDKLCHWLFSTIDGSWAEAERRLSAQRPYDYDDLLEIDKDSVLVFKEPITGKYSLESARVGAYEEFVAVEDN